MNKKKTEVIALPQDPPPPYADRSWEQAFAETQPDDTGMKFIWNPTVKMSISTKGTDYLLLCLERGHDCYGFVAQEAIAESLQARGVSERGWMTREEYFAE